MASRKPFFSPPNLKVDFVALEKELLNHWYESGIVDKYLKRNVDSEKYFSFIDGPITANNPMGVHHAWGRTYKDLWQKYKNMQGFKQRFQNGFDSQGLWVEVEVEKELNFRNKSDIEEYGVEKFVDKCKERVVKYSDIQTEQSKRLGYFMDWDNSYFTMSDDNNYMIWHFIKVCNDNGWLYKGNESVPWCPRCQTAISQHEILTEDYKEVSHASIIMEFPIEEREGEFLLVWTTTPWTIPANITVAVDKKIDYSLVEGEKGDKFWLAKDAVDRVFGKGDKKVLKTVKGEELVGLKYKGPFDGLPAVAEVAKENKDTFHTVIPTDERIMPISTDEGTGMVHTAVSAGTEDYKLGKKLGLPMIPVIADNADYLDGLGFLSGKNAKKHPELILNYLKEEDGKDGVDWVFDIFNYKHRYPACWRCKTELVWKVTDEWYIAMDKGDPSLRERIEKVVKTINWIPEFGLKRELDWINNMHDWLISKKNRYWGLALPIWECTDCDEYKVVGSKDELKEKASEGWDKFEGKTPHKPQIDEIKVKCERCGGLMERIEPVGNPWLDAGIVGVSTIKKDNLGEPLYLTDKEEWRKWFPATFISESFPGQFKNWFYSLIAMSTALEDVRPTDTIMGYATLFAENGTPMHKSAGNMITFDDGADKIGVDVMRWMYLKQNYSDNLLFGYKMADETRRRFHLKLWNVYNFFVTYANLDGWKPESEEPESEQLLDIWILDRFNETLSIVEKKLDEYDAGPASMAVEEFVDDLSNWYIRRSRDRVGPTRDADALDRDFYSTCYFVLTNLSKMLAPFMPYISDTIFTNLTKEESVHLADWPKVIEFDEARITKMRNLRETVEKAHAVRRENEIPVRTPLSLAKVFSPQDAPPDEYLQLFKDEVNVLDVKWSKKASIEVELDTKVTPELEEISKSRELIRSIQSERKEMNLDLIQYTKVENPWLPEDKENLERVKRKTLTRKITKGDKLKVEVYSDEG